MEKKDKIFITIFIISILGTLIFLSLSMTGMITESTFCFNSECHQNIVYLTLLITIVFSGVTYFITRKK